MRHQWRCQITISGVSLLIQPPADAIAPCHSALSPCVSVR